MKKKAHKGLGNGVFYLVSLAVCLGTSAPVGAAPLKSWQYDPTANQLEIILKDGVKPRYFLMARPARIVLDLPDTEVGDVQRQQTYDGAVRQVRVSQVKPGLARIVLELSPDATLMRGQAQLQRVSDAEQSTSDRWVLRPLIAQTVMNPTVATPSFPVSQLPSTAIQHPPGLSPSETAASESRHVDRPITPVPDKPIDIAVPPPITAAPIFTNLPPTTVPLVVAQDSKMTNLPTPPAPENFPPGIAPTPEQPVTNLNPAISSAPPQAPTSEPMPIAQKPALSLQLPDVNPSLAIPDSLPPVTAPGVQSAPTVSVPPLDSRVSPSPSELPPSTVINPNAAVSPPLPFSTPNPVTVEHPLVRSPANTIEFGQPLPTLPVSERSLSQSPGLMSYNSALLPAGTVVSLRYPGTQVLPLSSEPRQEVLLLQSDLRDRSGRLIASEGTQVLGKFETNGGGSRFIAQAILLRGQNVAIAAQSDILGGARKVSDNRLIRNSGIGALAGAILGGLSGGNVVGGAAAGAAVTYATAPKSATIQPGQILDVRLTEDLK